MTGPDPREIAEQCRSLLSNKLGEAQREMVFKMIEVMERLADDEDTLLAPMKRPDSGLSAAGPLASENVMGDAHDAGRIAPHGRQASVRRGCG